MTEDQIITTLEETSEAKKKKVLCLGLDIGTMNIVLARSDTTEIKTTRNVFLPVREDEITISDLSDINYIQSDDGNIYIIGEDAFRFANIFSKEVSRPMEKGLISPKEINAIDVLAMILKNMIGKCKGWEEIYCSYGIPAEAIDENRSVTYHEKVFGKILGSFGINHGPINEAAAIVYSECKNEKFSGIGISFGAGMVNSTLMFHGIEAGKFSVARSGDYVDKSVAEALNIIQNRITAVKEKNMDLSKDFSDNPNKKLHRTLEALHFYYESMIDYVVKKMIDEFNKRIDIEIDEKIPIILSGGTSLPNGFLEMFKNVFSRYTFPLEISEIRRAVNPMTAVAQGLLIKTISDVGNR